MNNYLSNIKQKSFYDNRNYLEEKIIYSTNSIKYDPILPNNIDVFSDIDLETIYKDERIDLKRLNKFIREFKKALIECTRNNGKEISLPKLNLTIDDDNALVFSWIHDFFRIIMSIEVKDEESFYGIYYRNIYTDEIESRSARLPENNYFKIFSDLIYRVQEIFK